MGAMRPTALYLVASVLLLAFLVPSSQAVAIGSCTRGRATAYTVETVGSCGYGNYRDIYTFAPNTQFYNGAAKCGACFEVSGPSGSHIMMAADECPTADNAQWCSGDVDHFDFNEEAFPAIAPISWGVTYTSIRPIVCPTTAPVSIISGWGSGAYNDYYLQVHFFNHKVPLQSVRVADAGNPSWTSLSRTDYNAFEYSPGHLIAYPVTYELTSIFGEAINVSLAAKPTGQGQKFDGTTQFSQWTEVAENVCPSFYEYDIFLNGLNNGNGKATAQNWQTVNSANVAYTGSLPSNATKAAQYSITNYNEWGFYTAGSAITVNSIAAVEVQLSSGSGSFTGLQLMWGEFGDGYIVDFPEITTSWQYFYFPKAEFGSAMTNLQKLAFKNNAGATITLNVANFRILPDASVTTSPPPSAPSGSPPGTPGTPGTPVTPGTPSNNPSNAAPTASASRISFGSFLVVVIPAILALLF